MLFGALIAGAVFAYFRVVKQPEEPSVIESYSGGLSSEAVPKSVVTEETEAAKRFLQAVQSKNAAEVDQLASEALKLQVKLETQNDYATVLSYFEGRFDSIDFDTLVSTIAESSEESSAQGKLVIFSDRSSVEGASGTYRVEVLVVEEAGILKINCVTTDLTF